jgi:hypothetical protein
MRIRAITLQMLHGQLYVPYVPLLNLYVSLNETHRSRLLRASESEKAMKGRTSFANHLPHHDQSSARPQGLSLRRRSSIS